MKKLFGIEILGIEPLTNDDVLYQLREGGIKMVIGNKKMTSQISWAPDNKIEIITIKNGKEFNHFFYKFEEMETINWIRKTYPTENFYMGYIKENYKVTMETYEKFEKLIEDLGPEKVLLEVENYFNLDQIEEFCNDVANLYDLEGYN